METGSWQVVGGSTASLRRQELVDQLNVTCVSFPRRSHKQHRAAATDQQSDTADPAQWWTCINIQHIQLFNTATHLYMATQNNTIPQCRNWQFHKRVNSCCKSWQLPIPSIKCLESMAGVMNFKCLGVYFNLCRWPYVRQNTIAYNINNNNNNTNRNASFLYTDLKISTLSICKLNTGTFQQLD